MHQRHQRQRKHEDTKQLFAQHFPSLEAQFLGSICKKSQHSSSTKNFEEIGDRWRYGSASALMGGRREHSEDASISTASSKGPYEGQPTSPTSLNYEHRGHFKFMLPAG